MLIKASIADVLKTEQSFSYVDKANFSSHFSRYMMCIRAEAKKPDYIWMVDVHEAIKLTAKWHIINCDLVDVNPLNSNNSPILEFTLLVSI
mgnify:CR=1 FL=1